MVKCWGSMLDWFNLLHNNPDFEEIEFIYVEPEKEKIEFGWPAVESEDTLTENETNRGEST